MRSSPVRLLPSFLIVFVGCTPAPETPTCAMPCAAGLTCVNGACVGGAAMSDLGAPDAAAQCVPACGGATPYCSVDHCVACLVDDHCPAGTSCVNGACAAGCTGDARCRGDGAGVRRRGRPRARRHA